MAEIDQFTGKIALVTGGGRGIGRAIALRLADLGADVVISYVRNQAPAEEVVQAIRARGRRSQAVRANLAKLDDIARLFQVIRDEFGGWTFSSPTPLLASTARPCSKRKPAGITP